jgi:integrase
MTEQMTPLRRRMIDDMTIRNMSPNTQKIYMSTLSTVGVDVSPHLFRTSAASAAATYGGENPYLGSAVLHHTDPRVTNDHYNRATSLSAAESFRQIVRQYEKK